MGIKLAAFWFALKTTVRTFPTVFKIHYLHYIMGKQKLKVNNGD